MARKKLVPEQLAPPPRLTWQALFVIALALSLPVAGVLWGIEAAMSITR